MTTPPRSEAVQGLIWALISVIASTAMGVAVRYAVDAVSSEMVTFLRGALTLILIGGFILFWRQRPHFSNPKLHLIRGALMGCSTLMGFYTISVIPLTTATVLFFITPIFATLLSVLFMGQSVGPRRIAAIAAGFVGAVIVVRPGFDGFHIGMLVGVVSALIFATALVMARGLAQRDGAFATFVSTTFMTFAVSAPLAGLNPDLPPSTWAWIAVAGVVVTGALRQIADIQSYRYADAAVIAPLGYMRIVFTAIAAYFLFDEIPDGATILGGVIIIGASIYIVLRERRTSRTP